MTTLPPIEQRRDATRAEVTLDGLPAAVCGAACRFPTVRTHDTSRSANYSWSAVLHVLANGGHFKTGANR